MTQSAKRTAGTGRDRNPQRWPLTNVSEIDRTPSRDNPSKVATDPPAFRQGQPMVRAIILTRRDLTLCATKHPQMLNQIFKAHK